MIIDLHSHLIPGVDDGAQTIEDSLLLAKQAVSEGVEHLVLTPHYYNGRYINHAKDVVVETEKLQAILDRESIPLKVYPGQEIRINESIIDQLLNQDLLSLDDGGKYYLIEFPTASVPDYSKQILQQLINRGITPVIAHPERNHVFAKNLDYYSEFIAMGCLGQLTTSSIAGAFGEFIQGISYEMVQRGLVHILASDAHSVEWRSFNIEAGNQALKEAFGQEKLDEFIENSRKIFNGDNVISKVLIPRATKKKPSFFSRFNTK